MIQAPATATPSGLLTFRDLRRDPSLAPGGERFPLVIHRFLPVVHGVARALIPEDATAGETVSLAVFEVFKKRWRRISRGTYVGAWLARSAWFAVARHRSRLGLKLKPTTPDGLFAYTALRAAHAFKQKWTNVVAVNFLLGEALPRSEKIARKAAAKIARKTKQPPQEVISFLEGFRLTVVDDLERLVAAKVSEPALAAPPSELAAGISSAWRWLAGMRLLKFAIKGAASLVALIAVLLLAFAGLYLRGQVIPFFIRMGQKDLVKSFPGLNQPARPLPAGLAATKFPKSSAELFAMTNIWPVTLRMNRQEWRNVQPRGVRPVSDMNAGGRFQLRNPNASRSGLAGVMGIDFQWAEGAVEFAGKTFKKTGLRMRGNGTYIQSLYGDKQSYKVDLNRNVKGQDIAGVNTLNLVNAIPDFSYLHDALAEKLFRDLGVPAPRVTYAYVTLEVPGKFGKRPLGLFALIEDIDGDFAKDRFGSKTAPIFKPVTYDLFGDWGDDWKAYADIYDLKTKASPEQLGRVVEFARLVSKADDAEFARRLPDFLDLEEYAGFVAGHVLTSSYDGYLANGQNFYLYLDPRSNKFGFIPWDQDHGWGEFGYVGKAAQREDASIWHPEAYDNKFLKRVMQVDAFREIYRRKLEQGLAGPFTVERLYSEIDALAAVIRPAVAAESDFRLKRFEIAVSDKWVEGPRDATRSDYKEGPHAPAHQIKRFIEARVKSVRDQLDGKHEGVRLKGFNQ